MDKLTSGISKLSKYPLPVPSDAKSFDELMKDMESWETLDIVLFSCPASWYSMQIQGGRYTHVAVVYRRDDVFLKQRDQLNPDSNGKILLLESVMGDQEERTSGVDLVDARERW
jgi:hypothetical protein